jgi:acyl-CoA synthetase (AMP-forming)/AMP-acid ligase II
MADCEMSGSGTMLAPIETGVHSSTGQGYAPCPSNAAAFLLGGKDPQRVALEFLAKNHSYGDLQRAASSVGSFLIAAGGRKGDRVILIGDNSFFWVAAYLGTLRSGLVSVPLPTNLSRPDLEYILATTEPRFAFLQAGFAAKHREAVDGIELITDAQPLDALAPAPNSTPGGPDLGLSDWPPNLPRTVGDDLAALMFTSGSTGAPRGVMVSHANIIANTESIVEYLGLTATDRIMTVLPFHYCFGTSLLHTHLRVGGTLVVDSRFMYPEEVLQRMQRTECTGFAGVPSHFQLLLRNSSLRKKSFPHLRYVQQAGGHLAPTFIKELRNALPGTRVFVMYGQTEATARLSYLPPEYLDTKCGSIGKGMPGVKLRVVNNAGAEVRPGEVGEIVAQGENVALGYWRASEESAVSFRDGRLYTGDLATVDEDGFIFVVDRAKDFLKCSGKRTSCRQLEERLLEFEELLEVAIVGVPDEVLGEAVKAFVVPCKKDSGGLEEHVRQFCRKCFPPHLVPREIVVLSHLPKNSSGKVMKQTLKGR